MGKVEILTLIAGVVLSIALALIVVPLFSGSSEMTKKVQFKHEIVSLINHHDIWTQSRELNQSLNYVDSYASNMKDIKGDSTKGLVTFKSENTCVITFNDTDKDKIDDLTCKTKESFNSSNVNKEIEDEIKYILNNKKINFKDDAIKINP